MTQHHDHSNVLSGMKMAAPEEGQRKIFLAAKKKKANVHLLNTGHARKGLMVWYWVTCWETWGAKGITTCVAFLETRLHWFVHSIHLPPREREAVVRPAADPAFSSWLRRYLLRAAVKEFFKKESGSGGPLKYSFFIWILIFFSWMCYSDLVAVIHRCTTYSGKSFGSLQSYLNNNKCSLS